MFSSLATAARSRQLPSGARVGTSSRRRAVQARAINPQIEIIELRGNLDTRLRKSAEPEYDGIIVAAAGLDRMGWQERITEYLPVERFVPSPGQGALAHRMPRGRCDAARRARPDRSSADAHRRDCGARRAHRRRCGLHDAARRLCRCWQNDTLRLWGMTADDGWIANARVGRTDRARYRSVPRGLAIWREALGLVSGVRA